MRIQFIEIQNFRKLKAIRIDFSEKTTLFVGANNSGKTSAMVALGHFLVKPRRFTTNDFTISHWAHINPIGDRWARLPAESPAETPSLQEWEPILPSLDIWLEVAADELHYAHHLLPTLDWSGGLIGVRLRFEPEAIDAFFKDFIAATSSVRETKAAAAEKTAADTEYTVPLWPHNMRAFLDRKLHSVFAIRAYLLDPTKCQAPENGIARPQPLPNASEPIDGNPLDGLLRIDEIAAQRGLGDPGDTRDDSDGQETSSSRERRRLSEQLRSYYSKHLDPSDYPEPADLDALDAIDQAHKIFDNRLATGFSAAIKELESLNYPGVTDPKLTITTKMRPTDGLNHNAAVQYEVISDSGSAMTASFLLPEEYNGLGYQNLISMVFRLMSFRDAWMRVGKAGRVTSDESKERRFRPPLHLVLVEEPEAHLHAQVQQVFVRKAYDVLRNHGDLGDKRTLWTQLVVSTHSSHVAHECGFSCLRYFRRLAVMPGSPVPTSAVINLSEVFGPKDETENFVTRYLRATHCDLFFADAAILVEGPAERVLLPHFIRKCFPALSRSYLTLLEINGSHAHRLRPLIEHLGLTTLIVTDIDSVEAAGHHKKVPPQRAVGQLTANATLKQWHPKKTSLDDLLNLTGSDKVKMHNIAVRSAPAGATGETAEAAAVRTCEVSLFGVRVAYQTPLKVKMKDTDTPVEALASTFEDSLVFENVDFFKQLNGDGLIAKFKDAITRHSEPAALGEELHAALNTGEKAAFALDLLSLERTGTPPDSESTTIEELKIPGYIDEGLEWLQGQLLSKRNEVFEPVPVAGAPEDK